MSPGAGLIEPFDDAAVPRAAALLRAGGLVAFPTETVYGLGANARDDRAVARVFAAKGRPQFNPLIVHAPDLETAAEIAELSPMALALAERFWPGPLTLVARRRGSISDLAAAGLDTVAVRVPGPERTRRLIEAAGGAVAAPSANPSGRLSPTDAAAVADGLGDAVDLILDGGPCPVGVESTIIALTEPGPRLLREGGVPREALNDALEAIGAPAVTTGPLAQAAPQAPGMLLSHYAPAATLRLDAKEPGPGEAWLAFGAAARADRPSESLSVEGDLTEAAANLFAALRRLDQAATAPATIAVAPIPERGLGRAINDRLRRAAAPR